MKDALWNLTEMVVEAVALVGTIAIGSALWVGGLMLLCYITR